MEKFSTLAFKEGDTVKWQNRGRFGLNSSHDGKILKVGKTMLTIRSTGNDSHWGIVRRGAELVEKTLLATQSK